MAESKTPKLIYANKKFVYNGLELEPCKWRNLNSTTQIVLQTYLYSVSPDSLIIHSEIINGMEWNIVIEPIVLAKQNTKTIKID